MPRSNRPRRGGRPATGARGAAGRGSPDAAQAPDGAGWAGQQLDEQPDGTWSVRRISGAAATKPYRCPGCDQEIRPGTPHVVAWPAEPAVGPFGGPHDRRHWHSPCWATRARRVRRTR